MSAQPISCRHKTPVFGCEGCIYKRGPLYSDGSLEPLLSEIETKTQKVYDELEKLKKPPTKVSAAIDNLYDAISDLQSELLEEDL